jgi:hypothetical protein
MTPVEKRTLMFGMTLVGFAVAFATTTIAETPAAGMPGSRAERVARGAYLVHAMGCNDCPTPYTLGPNATARDRRARPGGGRGDRFLDCGGPFIQIKERRGGS